MRTILLGKQTLLPRVMLALSAAWLGALSAGCVSAPRPVAMQRWQIVVAPDAAPAVAYAAAEFREFFRQATGHELALATVPAPRGRRIFIGPSAALRGSALAIEPTDLAPEDFRMIIQPGDIAICGGNARGTLYGVYTFLEDYLGVRFLTADQTHVPKAAAGFVLPLTERTFRPVLAFRCGYYGPNHANPAFAVRLRNNAITDDPKLGGRASWELINHSMSGLLPVREYGRAHPDYFALVDGKRRGDVPEDHYGAGGTQPCLTNPAVKGLIIEHVLAQLRKQPGKADVSVSQNDNDMYCRCDACRAIDEREGSPMGSLLTLVNEAADAVAAAYPGVCIGTLSYQYSRKPPLQLRPRPNVAIQLCSIEACLLHAIDDPACPDNAAFCRDLAAWGKICGNIQIWNYNVNFRDYLSPCPNLRVIGPNLRYFVANNAKGVFMQAAGGVLGSEFADLRNYLICNLMWDPTRNENRLMEEFLSLHYGRAAPAIRSYLDLIHNNARDRKLHHHCFGRPADYGIDETITVHGLALFEEAMTLAENDEVRRRVEKASITLHRARLDPVARWVSENLATDAAGDLARPYRLTANARLPVELAGANRAGVRRFLELCEKHGVTALSETVSYADGKRLLRSAFGLGDDEPL